jgi:hypothetical protein
MVNLLAPTVEGLVTQLLPWLQSSSLDDDDQPPPVGLKPSASFVERELRPLVTIRAPTFDIASAPHVPVPSPLSAHSRALVEAVYGLEVPAPVLPFSSTTPPPVIDTAPLFSSTPEVSTGSWRRVIPPLSASPASSRAPSPVSITLRSDEYRHVSNVSFPGAFSIQGHHAVLQTGHTIEVMHDDKFCLTVFADNGDEWVGEVVLSAKMRKFPGLVTTTGVGNSGVAYTTIAPCQWDFPFEYQFSLFIEAGSSLDLPA